MNLSRPISMVDVIERGVRRLETKPCPWCGTDPGNAARVSGRHIIACENGDCPAMPQVGADTVVEAWQKWNARK